MGKETIRTRFFGLRAVAALAAALVVAPAGATQGIPPPPAPPATS